MTHRRDSASRRQEAPAAATCAPLILTEADAAAMLRLSPRTLQRMRLEGGGPRFVRLTDGGARIGYRVADLDKWLTARTVASTSDVIARPKRRQRRRAMPRRSR